MLLKSCDKKNQTLDVIYTDIFKTRPGKMIVGSLTITFL